ncbi:uncharacterized protein [Cicer arietinum]|uniref:uncharacterized protein isoform X3 n=1 Tax=Cicer arietinum TaxID=3827 RepID=UPI003CC6CA44
MRRKIFLILVIFGDGEQVKELQPTVTFVTGIYIFLLVLSLLDTALDVADLRASFRLNASSKNHFLILMFLISSLNSAGQFRLLCHQTRLFCIVGNTNPIGDVLLQQFELEKQSESDFLCDIDGCKAGNLMCSSLILEEEKKHSPAMPCDICCTELNFCRECCCILCCKTVDSAYGGYSYIMCKVKVGDNICGHVAHMECALRAHMAGTVGGMIGLDAEYYCRRCDGRTELISHANKILLVCEAIDSEGDIKEKMLNLGMCLLCGSQKAAAKELMSRIALAMSKLFDEFGSLLQLKRGNNTEDILNVDDKLTAHSAGFSINGSAAMDTTDDESPLNHLDVRIGKKYFGYRSESLKLEAEVDQVLEALRKSQKYEYNLAEESLNEHKKYLQNLYQQLDREKSELASQPNGSHSGVLFETVKERKEQLRRELMKFENMKRVANGFGSTSKDILEKYFGL